MQAPTRPASRRRSVQTSLSVLAIAATGAPQVSLAALPPAANAKS